MTQLLLSRFSFEWDFRKQRNGHLIMTDGTPHHVSGDTWENHLHLLSQYHLHDANRKGRRGKAGWVVNGNARVLWGGINYAKAVKYVETSIGLSSWKRRFLNLSLKKRNWVIFKCIRQIHWNSSMIRVFKPAAHARTAFCGLPEPQFLLPSLNPSVGIAAAHLRHSNCIAAQRIKQVDGMTPLIFTCVKGTQTGGIPVSFISAWHWKWT